MPTIDEIMKNAAAWGIVYARERDEFEAAIESAIREARDAVKDCRTCTRYVYAQCELPDGHSGCSNMSAYAPTQPVRLWEK